MKKYTLWIHRFPKRAVSDEFLSYSVCIQAHNQLRVLGEAHKYSGIRLIYSCLQIQTYLYWVAHKNNLPNFIS